MNVRRKRFNWIIAAAVVSAIHGLVGFTARADAQTVASLIARSTTSGESTARHDDPTNAELQQRVVAALQAQPYLEGRHIDVSVRGGAVVLSGTVFSAWDLQDALQVARETAGARPVIDRLSIEAEQRR